MAVEPAGVDRSAVSRPDPAVAGPGATEAGPCPDDEPRRPFAVEFVSTVERLQALGGELDELMERTGAPASARWPAIGAGLAHAEPARPWCVIVRSGPVIVAAALLSVRRKRGAWVLNSASHVDEQGWLPAVDADAAGALAAELCNSLGRLHLPWFLELHQLPPDDPTASALCRVLKQSMLLPGAEVPVLDCGEGARIGTCLSPNTRSAVNRARKRIAVAGLKCEIDWARDPLAIEARLDSVVELHRQRNRQLRGAAGLDDPRKRALFIDTVNAQARAGRARVLTLRLDDALAAFAICFEAAGKLHVYSNMASPDWLDFSPGTIANSEVVLAALRDPALRYVDWGGGLQRYKLSGTGVHIEHLQHFRAWSSTASHLAWRVIERLRHG
jgi:CelD/BcsL family acetyltransferase involved in cellulose biosynthesis